ncbi:MAG: putative sulfate exporter family transporter [Ginsengibacter sp.]
MTLVTSFFYKTGKEKIEFPYFIVLFILAMVINTFFPVIHPVSDLMVSGAKRGLTVTLFLIGAGLSMPVIKNVGIKPLVQGIVLWIGISIAALWAVMHLMAA